MEKLSKTQVGHSKNVNLRFAFNYEFKSWTTTPGSPSALFIIHDHYCWLQTVYNSCLDNVLPNSKLNISQQSNQNYRHPTLPRFI